MKPDFLSGDVLLGFSVGCAVGCVVGLVFELITTPRFSSWFSKRKMAAPRYPQMASGFNLDDADFKKRATELQEAFKLDEQRRREGRGTS